MMLFRIAQSICVFGWLLFAALFATDAVTVEVTGNAEKLEAFLRVLEPFGIRELVQSGMVAIGRGGRSITERTLKPVPVPVPSVAG